MLTNKINSPFTWSPSERATSYDLIVSEDSTFNTCIYANEVGSVTSQQVYGLLPGTTYYWKVNAHFSSPVDVPSEVWTFRTETGTLVHFNDANLEQRIREALGGYLRELITIKLKQLTNLWAAWANITDLTGIEYCTNLTWLGIPGNNITDFSKISSLTRLNGLEISENQIPISDFSFLYPMDKLLPVPVKDL